jgi:hypothetical protein
MLPIEQIVLVLLATPIILMLWIFLIVVVKEVYDKYK